MEITPARTDKRRLFARWFIRRLTTCVVVCAFLAFVNWQTSPHYWWVLWVIAGMGAEPSPCRSPGICSTATTNAITATAEKNETMDNKNFNADQSIELIQRMIRDTRRNLSSGSSNLFILWGYLLAATAVGIFLLLTFTESRAWQWLWLPALAAGWAATWWYSRRRATQVKSYTDRLLEQIWGCIAGLAAFSTFVICMEREWPVDPLFPVLLLISAGLFISGTVIHNKYMYYVSCFLLPVAFGIIRESWINVNPDGNLIQFAVAVLVGLTGSGYALKRQVKRDAAEASENR